MSVSQNILTLRRIPADEIVSGYEYVTSEQFRTASRMKTPNLLVLPECDEQADLPSALLTLSRSTVPVVPIVVENGSSPQDKAFEYAERMGAIALHCEPAKMRATQTGLKYARDHFPDQPVIHFGDADNLYPSVCIAAMAGASKRANRKNNNNGALVFGMGAYDHGPSAVVDVMRSGRLLRKAVHRKVYGKPPMPYGFNYVVHVDANDALPKALFEIDPRLFVREESEICKAALSAGAAIGQSVRLGTYVFTRGDLIRSRKEWREFRGAPMHIKIDYYERNYPDLDFTPNANGRT